MLILQVRWYTCAFNRWFFRLAQWRTQFWRYWFSAGIYFGIIAMVGSVVVLVIVIYNSFRQKSMEQQVLTPVVHMYPTEFVPLLCAVLREFVDSCLSYDSVESKRFLHKFSCTKNKNFVEELVKMRKVYLQMPGVNLPANQTVYYLLTLFFCGVLHEVGHAIAAVR